MTRIVLGIGVLALGAAALTAQSKEDRPSLGTVAKAAQEEKAKTAAQEKPSKPEKAEKPASKTYTNEDLGRRPRPYPVYAVDPYAQKPYNPDRTKDEAYWRTRAAPIHKAMDDTNYRLSQVKARLEAIKGNGLDVSMANGRYSPEQAERQRLAAQQQEIEAQLHRLEQGMAALEDEGRRAGALPGWFR